MSTNFVNIYQIGKTEPFFPLITSDRYGSVNWWEKQITIAYYFQCEPDDVGSHELDGGEEVITVRDNIVGSFDRPIELKRLFAESMK